MPFTSLQLHPSLLKAIRELGYTRPTPIQAEAITPAMEGRDILASAATGSGKTAAFLLPILHRIMAKPRRVTRALVLAPTRELAAQILQDLNDLAVHTPITGAAVYGGVGMGPQEHAFRSGVDVMIATPGRLLDHFTRQYAALPGVEYLVLDEADRMLDMGFLPDIKKVLRHLPAQRQTLCFSATLPGPIVALTRDILKNPVRISLEPKRTTSAGITQAAYPVRQDLKAALFLALLGRGDMKEALVFTRTKHRANRLALYLGKQGIKVERIHGNRSQQQRTEALAGFKSGKYRVLVATDIASRGIDVEALGHVVNFDVPLVPEDYIHRIGRTGRAEQTGEAFTLVAPDEENELRAIEKAVGKRLPRVVLPDFQYNATPEAKFEVPLAERIAEIRKRKSEDRARAAVNAARRGAPHPQHRSRQSGPASSPRDGASRGGRRGGTGGRRPRP